HYPFDLSKPLPLQGPPGHQTVAADYFFNNDLEYLKTSDPEVTYTSSITKAYVARYEIKGIEDMSVSVKKLHKYGHLEEIVVKRSDQQLYKFKEGDFVDLHLNDIEDMLLLAKRILRADELYKFSDGTLKSVRDEIHNRILDFHLDYNMEMAKKKWMTIDQKRSGLITELIDKQLRESKIVKNLERLVGTRELRMDYKLMMRTV
nr:hypothetical protein [Tanacetum cinerariifolium]